MAPVPQPTLLSPTELSYLHTSLSLTPPIRPDARSPTTFRPLVAETDLLPSANGSARLCFADGTEAIVGVKADVEKTAGGENIRGLNDEEGNSSEDEDMGGMGAGDAGMRTGEGEDRWVEVQIDMPGQRDDDAMVVFLAQMIHEGLVADGGLRKRMVINRRWHWRLYIDILLLSPPHTYPLPLLSLTTHLALLSARLPAPISRNDEDPLFNDDWDASLPLYAPTSISPEPSSTPATAPRPPITLLVISVGANIFFDPTHSELAVADAILAVTVASPPLPAEKLNLLAVRTVDPPSRLSLSASDVGQAAAGSASKEGVWRPKKGGVSRGVLRAMFEMCTERGGVGQEVLDGLERFT